MPNEVFGKPVLRKTGGRSIDDMATALGDHGYLDKDEHGKVDLGDFEEKFGQELSGDKNYSLDADYGRINGKPDITADELKEYPAGKLHRRMVEQMKSEIGADAVGRLEKLGMLHNDGVDPETVSDMYGFESGFDISRSLAGAEHPKDAIERLTNQRMLEQHGELSSPRAIQDAAEKAIHNQVRAKVMATTLKALTKSPISARMLEQSAKQVADETIAKKKVGEVNERPYLAAEAKAGKQVMKLAATDPKAAIRAQRSALLNNQLARAALDAKDEALLDSTKVLNHPDFREKFMQTYGKEEYAALHGWMRDIRDMYLTDPRNRGFENALQYTRQGVVMTGIAYRMTTVVKHGSAAAFKSLGYLTGGGGKYFAARMVRMASGHLQEDIAGAREKFPEIRSRMLQMDRDYKEGNKSMYAGEDWRAKNDRFGHAMVAWSDALSAVPLAWAAYDMAKTSGVPKSMGGTGKPMAEQDAVNYANSMVRQAHGSALEVARSNFMQAKGVKGLFGTIYGFMNNTYGQQRDMFDKAFTKGAFQNNPALVARALTSIIMPAVAAYWASNGTPDTDNDESWAGWGAKAVAGEVAGSVPFVRDAASMIEYQNSSDMVAPIKALSDVVKSVQDVSNEAQGKDTKLIQDIGNAVGEWAHIGGLGQAGKTLQYLRDVSNGKQNPDGDGEEIEGALLGAKH